MDDKKPTPATVGAFKNFNKSATEAAEKITKALDGVGEAAGKKPPMKTRAEHLMHKPFRDNAALREMQDKLRIQEGRKNRNPKSQRQR